MKYRKKPVVIEAEKWDGTEEGFHQLCKKFGLEPDAVNAYKAGEKHLYLDGVPIYPFPDEKTNRRFIIEAGVGHYWVKPSDFVIRDEDGGFSSCRPEVFEKTYEEVIE